MTDDNFVAIAAAVKEGRTIYDNLWKTILFILPTDGGEALIILVAILFGWVLPITPVQILWINTITAVTLGLALAFEPAEQDVMRRHPRKPDAPLFSSLLIWRIVFVSLLMMAGGFGLFLWAQETNGSLEIARTMTVNALVLGEIAYLFNTRRMSSNALTWNGLLGSLPVVTAVIVAILLQLGFTYIPFMQSLFGTVALNFTQWFFIVSFGVGLFLIVEFEKFVTRYFFIGTKI